jgi:paired amphipathic helix protein Sin3a
MYDVVADNPQKKASKADSPSGEDGETSVAALPGTTPQTLASPDEVAFFDKVKKFIDDKYTYHEFLKLINLFTQDMLDTKGLVERAEQFIGQSGEIWTTFKKMVLADDAGNVPPNPTSAQVTALAE